MESALRGNFSASTARRIANRKSTENLLLAASNLKISTFREAVYTLCSLGIYVMYKTYKADDKVKEAVEFGYKVMDLENVSPAIDMEKVIKMDSGDIITLRNATDEGGHRILLIKFNNGGYEKLIDGSLVTLKDNLFNDFSGSPALYEKFSSVDLRGAHVRLTMALTQLQSQVSEDKYSVPTGKQVDSWINDQKAIGKTWGGYQTRNPLSDGSENDFPLSERRSQLADQHDSGGSPHKMPQWELRKRTHSQHTREWHERCKVNQQ